MWVDSHCHLYSPDFAPDLDAVLARAAAAGVDRMVVPADSFESAALIAGLCQKYPQLSGAAGVHPENSARWTPGDADRLRALCREPAMLAVGEIGLDYHWNPAPRPVQIACLEAQLAVALETGKPAIVHCRESQDDMLPVLQPFARAGGRGVMHCFSGDEAFARACLDLGFFISFAGQVTYPKAGALREVAKGLPIGCLLVETDSPYLSPQPVRGRRNEPAHLPETGKALAALRNEDVETFAQATAQNARTLFGLA